MFLRNLLKATLKECDRGTKGVNNAPWRINDANNIANYVNSSL